MQPGGALRKKILVVDDDRQIQVLLAKALGEQYEVTCAYNGIEALEAVKRQRPDLVLCDVLMPEMDGLECLQRMSDLAPGLRVVMMTGETSTNTILSSLRGRAFDFLAKPFSVDQLRLLVSEALDYTGPEEFRVLSATPQWVEIEAPCSLASGRRLQRFLSELKTGLPEQTQMELAAAFRELLQNAVEHGGKNDPTRLVRICYLRLERLVVYRIQDPGEGFCPDKIIHAAVANPPDDPLRHVQFREQMQMRPGGFGLFITHRLVDELIFNQKCNEVLFVKYLPPDPGEPASN